MKNLGSNMKIHKKLMQARIELQKKELNKSGHNKFANYKYFELSDFLNEIQQIFNNLNLCSVVSFSKEYATLTIFDCDSDESIVFTSPMADANLKGTHPIQNLGAVETYSRRYLYVTALEIVEHDALDATTGSDAPKSAKPITKDVFDSMTAEEQESIRSIGVQVISLLAMDDVEGAVQYIEQCELDADSKTALWSLLDSKQRAAIKKYTTR
jgi:phosphatidate phosphatase PAH1